MGHTQMTHVGPSVSWWPVTSHRLPPGGRQAIGAPIRQGLWVPEATTLEFQAEAEADPPGGRVWGAAGSSRASLQTFGVSQREGTALWRAGGSRWARGGGGASLPSLCLFLRHLLFMGWRWLPVHGETNFLILAQ